MDNFIKEYKDCLINLDYEKIRQFTEKSNQENVCNDYVAVSDRVLVLFDLIDEVNVYLLSDEKSGNKTLNYLKLIGESYDKLSEEIKQSSLESNDKSFLFSSLLKVIFNCLSMGDFLFFFGSQAEDILGKIVSELNNEDLIPLYTTVKETLEKTYKNVRSKWESLYKIVEKEAVKRGLIEAPAEDTSKKGCYIATAVYGSYNCPQVWTLRRYRDNMLAKTWYGRAFIHTYYAISPTLVKWFGNTDWFKKMWKGKLDHMVSNLQSQGVECTPYEDLD